MEEKTDPFKNHPAISALLKQARLRIKQFDDQIKQLPKDQGLSPELSPSGSPPPSQQGRQAINKGILERRKNEIIKDSQKAFDRLVSRDSNTPQLKEAFQQELLGPESEKEKQKDMKASERYMDSLLYSKLTERFNENSRDLTVNREEGPEPDR